MKRIAILTAAIALAGFGTASAQAPAAPAAASAPAAATAKLSIQTKVGELAANPASKAVLQKYIPQVVSHPQFGEAADMTLTELMQYAPEITPEVLKKIDEDLAKL